MLSVIISATNEIENSYFWSTLNFLNSRENIESIVAIDKNKNHQTYERVKKNFDRILCLHLESHSRAARLNHGLKRSQFEKVLYQHPRSFIDEQAYDYLIHSTDELPWAALEHQFDYAHPILQFTSWYSNHIRLKRSRIAYLDHCIFINKKFYELNSLLIPEVDIFEDTILSKQLSSKYPPKILPFKSTTSAIRFQKNGVYKQSALNQILKLGYFAGIDHQKMNHLYEKGLSLNSKYNKKKN